MRIAAAPVEDEHNGYDSVSGYYREVLIARRSRFRKGDEPVIGVFERAWISAVSAGVAGSATA